ncbi:IS66 family transposase [Halosquirtibacter xylanolyticus]|uniref:IS66 family transposase n=1 Tax=Halosquirtibacter xylanolyticus TaxID=3374599 RepID=UPI00374891B0|nr:IS66 family transposase [Prolixibacteraceae bacterium]QZT37625.1 IS66 family transposase [Prolixibacteraceae bacterium]
MNQSDNIDNLSINDLLKKLQQVTKAYASIDSENVSLKQEIEELKAHIAYLNRRIFGMTTEPFIDPNQLELDLPIEENSSDNSDPVVEEEVVVEVKKKKRAKRKHIPKHLPRQEEVIEPDEIPDGAIRIGEEVSERIEFEPGKLYVRRIVRPKYSLPKESGVIVAELPSDIIPRCMAGTSLISQFIVGKYFDHIPLYRAQGIFKRSGIEFPKSTINGWMSKAAELLTPLYEHVKHKVVSSDYIQADETTIKVLTDKKPGATHLGYFWVYYAPHLKCCLFDYNKSRNSDVPDAILKDFKGVLQTDGYQGYNKLSRDKPIIRLACMAHARRKFFDAQKNDKERSEYALIRIQKLYQIERECVENNLSHEEIFQLRQEKAVPILTDIGKWLETQASQVLPQSLIGKAVHYTWNLWNSLSRYVEHGSYIIDNNFVENKIRPVAIGRKNYLFAGSEDGAQRSALFYTLSAMCKVAEVDPHAWFTDVLNRIIDTKPSQYDDLLPEQWKKKIVQ